MTRGTVAAPPSVGLHRRPWVLDVAVLAAVAAVIRLPAFLTSRDLSYDDGFFGLVAVEMRHGVIPYRDLFMPQSPLHPVLLFLADLLGLRTANAPRVLPLLAGVAVTVATYAAARQITSRYGAVLAAVLVTTSGSVLWVTAGIAADGGAIALAVAAVALALRATRSDSPSWTIAAGLCTGAAIAAKALAAPVLLPVALLLLVRRRPRDLVWAAGAVLVVPIVTALAWGPGLVWEQSVQYNRGATRLTSHWGAFTKIVRTLVERDLPVLAAAGLAVVAAGVQRVRGASTAPPPNRERRPWWSRPAIVLVAWLVAELALLVIEPALWRPHVAHLIAPIALLVARRPPPLVPVLIVALLVAPWYYDHLQPMLRPGGFDRTEAGAVQALEQLPSGAQVLSDNPGLVWRSDRRIPPEFADSSIKRIENGQISRSKLASAARAEDVCAVLVWTDRYRDLDLAAPLARAGYDVTRRFGGPRVLYQRSECPA